MARSWQLCQVTGAPIADAANRVADGLRADAATERLVAAELAAPRASGRMLAALPVLGIGLGFVGGGNPIDFLGRTDRTDLPGGSHLPGLRRAGVDDAAGPGQGFEGDR